MQLLTKGLKYPYSDFLEAFLTTSMIWLEMVKNVSIIVTRMDTGHSVNNRPLDLNIPYITLFSDGLVVCHLPYGPTAYFTLSSTVMRHDIPNIGTMSEVYPHLIFWKILIKTWWKGNTIWLGYFTNSFTFFLSAGQLELFRAKQLYIL